MVKKKLGKYLVEHEQLIYEILIDERRYTNPSPIIGEENGNLLRIYREKDENKPEWV